MISVARIPTVALAALLGVLYLALNPPSADIAAHLSRADLVQRAGLVVWDNSWYAGHPLPGYSLLFPWLGALIGVRLAGALSALAATAIFAKLAADEFEPGALDEIRPVEVRRYVRARRIQGEVEHAEQGG